MAMPVFKKPVYDERSNEILRMLTEGMSRDEVAAKLGYSNTRSMHTVMNRKNFVWDERKKNYVPAYSQYHDAVNQAIPSSSKMGQILSLFAKEGADAKEIAKRLGFADHREMASYIKGKGYVWDNEKQNYVKYTGELSEESDRKQELPEKPTEEDAIRASPVSPRLTGEGLERYLPLLDMLERNRDRLIDLLVPASTTGQIPRYAVPGIFTTKTVHMTNLLDQMVRDFSREKNISQREIFECALIEFFRRYGYEREVEQLLGR
ncbi:hypothetical protein [Brevibacillus borstelensis]|uniref:hypothetical protein n=1 Tax=Brevibacillus borstelensis TaxID=45462 RepID=UPI001D0A7071|nr:hypothetical protein [Brevibacillus borstelensis]MCC0566896.1 hypothetical protein [Brevibacillus borstelensis]